MSQEIKRNYKGSDAEMLTAIAAIMQAAIDNQAELVAKRASWADPFFTNLKTAIDTAAQTYLGADSVKDLRKATTTIAEIQEAAISGLTETKVQIERDFRQQKPVRDELLNELGYKEFFRAAYDKDQGALVQLLFRFKQALTPGVQGQLTAKGVDAGTLTSITGFADVLNNANISQEAFKGSRKSSTQAAVTAFNEIYNKVIDVAVIAAMFFKGDKAKQARFSYAQVLKTQQGGAKSAAKKPVETPSTAAA